MSPIPETSHSCLQTLNGVRLGCGKKLPAGHGNSALSPFELELHTRPAWRQSCSARRPLLISCFGCNKLNAGLTAMPCPVPTCIVAEESWSSPAPALMQFQNKLVMAALLTRRHPPCHVAPDLSVQGIRQKLSPVSSTQGRRIEGPCCCHEGPDTAEKIDKHRQRKHSLIAMHESLQEAQLLQQQLRAASLEPVHA